VFGRQYAYLTARGIKFSLQGPGNWRRRVWRDAVTTLSEEIGGRGFFTKEWSVGQ